MTANATPEEAMKPVLEALEEYGGATRNVSGFGATAVHAEKQAAIRDAIVALMVAELEAAAGLCLYQAGVCQNRRCLRLAEWRVAKGGAGPQDGK